MAAAILSREGASAYIGTPHHPVRPQAGPLHHVLVYAKVPPVPGMMPHTHLRGVRWQYTLQLPDSTSSVILDVPHTDFNWQTYYMFAKPLEIAAGGKITSMAWYDNSASNKNNPDATKDVKWGDQPWEEMQYTGILFSVPSRRPKPKTGQE